MHVLVHESPAGKPAGPGTLAKYSRTQSMYSGITSMSTDVPFRNERTSVPNIIYWYIPVHTSTYKFMTLKYVPVHTFYPKYVLENIHLSPSMY
jgi:hypothetical protein